MTYVNDEEREYNAILARKRANAFYYNKLKEDKERYEQRLIDANIQATARAHSLKRELCIYCDFNVNNMENHNKTKVHIRNFNIMNKFLD